MLPTLSNYSKKVLITIMIVFPLALGVDSVISPYVVDLPSLAIAMIFVMIMTPIMTLLNPMVTELLEKLFSNKYKSNDTISNTFTALYMRNN